MTEIRMEDILQEILKASSIAIAGHVRPDGDCVGSCLALYNYLTTICEGEDFRVIDLYLEDIPEKFKFLPGSDRSLKEPSNRSYDLLIVLDCASMDRIGVAPSVMEQSLQTLCIDHHVSNTHFARATLLDPGASSTCEILFEMMDYDRIDRNTAECLYLGIVHDTGVFRHSCTTQRTLEIAGALVEKGVPFSRIIDETFYQKTYLQNQILGRCLLESIMVLDGRVIVSSISRKIQEFYGACPADLDGVIDQLRVTKGVEAAILIREEESQTYKVSMRSNGMINVSKIAVYFGGGGHVQAAGCTMEGALHDVINNLLLHMESQLQAAGQVS